ncbi:hypothetical protein [Catenuloplanes atrovinosus]|uniref:Uncharacterized protein n=1 Tax=Catenuloplanes atrovinosus TaxID=137266 RepID=A0AAE3YV13_9ACTN|nr:hypothetical protein [Catenuloplanes atrovinosus]MDR7278934.1 hypothetical protein [Catenuloplanes atrovinosus]
MTQPTGATPTAPAPDAAAREHLAEQAKEYGTYVATTDIYVGMALAYREGDPVPVSNVEAHGYEKNGLVAKTGTKAAAVAAGTAEKGGK